MAYNNDELRRIQEAKDDLAKKIILEKYLIKDLTTYYNKIKSAAKLLYSTNNTVLDVSIYKDYLIEILKTHYRRVAKQFGNLEARQLSNILGVKSASSNYDQLLYNYIEQQSQQQANYINNTDQQKLNDAFKLALVLWFTVGGNTPRTNVTIAPRSAIPQGSDLHTDSGRDIRPQAGEGITSENLQIVQSDDILENVSEMGINNYDSTLDTRKQTIALTETQNSAETSKALAVISYISGTGLETKKQWISILDDRVRPWHASAYGQIQKLDDPFIVYGQELMYPGDTSRGATMDNIANCRCSSHYYW